MHQALKPLVILIALTDKPQAMTPHDLELAAFGGTLAVTLVASKACADILVDKSLVATMSRLAHFDAERDKRAVDVATHAAVEVLANALKQAPSRQAWCDAVYRMYGPSGRIIPDLMRRQGSAPQLP